MTTKPTPLQKKVLNFIKKHDEIPPLRTIARHFGWASDNSARNHIKALKRRNLL